MRSVLRIIQIELHSPPAREKRAPWLLGAEIPHPATCGSPCHARARALTCYQTTARHFERLRRPLREDLMRLAIRFVAAVAALGLVAAHSGAPAQAQVITLNGAVQFNDDHAFTKALVKFEELVKKYYGKPINFVLHKQFVARPGEAVFRVHGAGQGGRLRDRVAGAHVDLLQGRAVHRRAVPVPRPRALEQGARRRPAQAGRRRDQREGRGDADRLCRRRHAQHLRQQAGAQPRRDQGR